MIKMLFKSFSEQGQRASNQDRLLAPSYGLHGALFAAIADGIGGNEGGAEAAQIAIDTIASSVGDNLTLNEKFSEAALRLRNAAGINNTLARMSTTLSVLEIRGEEVLIAHVGDTRIYHLRGNGIKTLTQDQTETAELVRQGVLRANQARKHPHRHILTSYLSPEMAFNLYSDTSSIKNGDRLLLMTDGAYTALSKARLVEISKNSEYLEDFFANLQSQVSMAKPKDNYSCLCMQYASKS